MAFPSLVVIMPIFRPNECLMVKIDNTGSVSYSQMEANTYIFIIFNWLEVIYMYHTWRRLRRYDQD